MNATASQRPAGGTVAAGSGCYKCGKKGHWARDCTASTAEQAEHKAEKARQEAAAAEAEAAASKTPAPATKQKGARKPRPKITLELLKEKDGLPEVFNSFPSHFRMQCKGPGHEVSDLRRLLDIYRRWQQRIFPSVPFNAFLEGVEKLGRTNLVKKELRELRQGVLSVFEDPQPDQEASGLAAAAQDQGADRADQEGNCQGDDEDELLAMQQETAAPAAARIPAGSAAARAVQDDVDDDELLGMLEDEFLASPAARRRASSPTAGPGATHGAEQRGAAGFGDVDVDDDELLAMLEDDTQAGHPRDAPLGAAAAGGLPGPVPAPAGMRDGGEGVDDDELMAMLEDDPPASQLGSHAPGPRAAAPAAASSPGPAVAGRTAATGGSSAAQQDDVYDDELLEMLQDEAKM